MTKKTKPIRRKTSSSTAAVPQPTPAGANTNNLPRTIALLANATRVLPAR